MAFMAWGLARISMVSSRASKRSLGTKNPATVSWRVTATTWSDLMTLRNCFWASVTETVFFIRNLLSPPSRWSQLLALAYKDFQMVFRALEPAPLLGFGKFKGCEVGLGTAARGAKTARERAVLHFSQSFLERH